MSKLASTFSLFLVLTLFFTRSVLAVDLDSFPQDLADRFNVDLFAGQMIATAILLMMFMLPTAIFTKTIIPPLFIGLVTLGVAIALGWLDYWFLLLVCVAFAALFSGKVRGYLTGGGGGGGEGA